MQTYPYRDIICYNIEVMYKRKTAGQLFRESRIAKGMTQSEVAYKAGIHPNTYAKIERDEQEASFSVVKRLAEILDLSLFDIPG